MNEQIINKQNTDEKIMCENCIWKRQYNNIVYCDYKIIPIIKISKEEKETCEKYKTRQTLKEEYKEFRERLGINVI